MIPVRLSLFLVCLLAATVAYADTALKALKALPKAEARKLAGIEASQGLPMPKHWRFLVRDSTTPGGMREYVVSDGEIVASRDMPAQPAAAGGSTTVQVSAIKVDSDRAASLALRCARERGLKVASLQYSLRQEGSKAAPLWAVTLLDPKGQSLGTLAITASRGNLVAAEGFSVVPGRPAGAPTPAPVSAAPVSALPGIDPAAVESDRQFLAEIAASTPPPAEPRAAIPHEAPQPAETSRLGERESNSTAAPSAPIGVSGGTLAGGEPTEVFEPEPETELEPEPPQQPARSEPKRSSSSEVSISPVREVRRATAPVRRIVRRVLPF